MHWKVPPDALPGSATLVHVLDSWLMDCIVFYFHGLEGHVIHFANQCPKMCSSRLVYTKVTYPATISACSGADQATAVGCKRV